MMLNSITKKVIGRCIKAHKNLVPGLLELSVEEYLSYELRQSGLFFERQKELSIIYNEIRMDWVYQ